MWNMRPETQTRVVLWIIVWIVELSGVPSYNK